MNNHPSMNKWILAITIPCLNEIMLKKQILQIMPSTSQPVGFELSSNVHMDTMHLATIFILYHESSLMYSLFGRHILFSVFILITLETLHTCVYYP